MLCPAHHPYTCPHSGPPRAWTIRKWFTSPEELYTIPFMADYDVAKLQTRLQGLESQWSTALWSRVTANVCKPSAPTWNYPYIACEVSNEAQGVGVAFLIFNGRWRVYFNFLSASLPLTYLKRSLEASYSVPGRVLTSAQLLPHPNASSAWISSGGLLFFRPPPAGCHDPQRLSPTLHGHVTSVSRDKRWGNSK